MPTSNAHVDAERLLRRVWPGPVPVDPIKIARGLGIKVYESLLYEDVSGLLIRDKVEGPRIILNASDTVTRRRVTCAHEIGHFVRRPEGDFRYLDKRDHLAAAGTDPEEMYANAFAAALLMPAADVQELHDKGFKEYEMALKFQVSPEAMRNRLKNLHLSV